MDDLKSQSDFNSSTAESQTSPGDFQTEQAQTLNYEETPIIEPIIEENSKEETVSMPPPSRKRGGFGKFFIKIIFISILFFIGFWLSRNFKQFLSSLTRLNLSLPEQILPASRTTPKPEEETEPVAGVVNVWKEYQVISSTTKNPVEGISFKLPAEVLEPICDGPGCISQGTYLPGGTRFTVAARGQGQGLRDYRGAIISDLSGRTFTTKETTVAGKPGVEFNGTFSGTTVGGYSFSQMRGVMISVTDTLSLEINHFTPSGVAADFAADETVFDKILQTFDFSLTGSAEKGGVIPSVSSTPSY